MAAKNKANNTISRDVEAFASAGETHAWPSSVEPYVKAKSKLMFNRLLAKKAHADWEMDSLMALAEYVNMWQRGQECALALDECEWRDRELRGAYTALTRRQEKMAATIGFKHADINVDPVTKRNAAKKERASAEIVKRAKASGSLLAH